jgi:hypothetical protein
MPTREDLEAEYDYYLNEQYDMVHLGDLNFTPSRIIKELDPIAYREGYWDYLDFSNQSEDDDEDKCLDAAFYVNESGAETVWSEDSKEAYVVRNGEMRIHYDDKVLRYTTDLVEAGITTDAKLNQLTDKLRLEFINNAWFEVWVKNDPDYFSEPIHDLASAIEEARKLNSELVLTTEG